MSNQILLLDDEYYIDEEAQDKRSFKTWQHMRARDGRDEWLTPPEILSALGQFDLDPCAPVQRPWDMAKMHFTIEDDGLAQKWIGRTFLNPPYSRDVLPFWMAKMAQHNNGIALIFARTETGVFHDYACDSADSLLFIKGRLHFYDVNGVRAKHNAGSPSVLIAYGSENTEYLRCCGIPGKLLPLNLKLYPVTIGFGSGEVKAHIGLPDFRQATWKEIVSYALRDLGGQAGLSDIYDVVSTAAVDKFKCNSAWKEQIRKVLQQHFTHVDRGIWALPEPC